MRHSRIIVERKGQNEDDSETSSDLSNNNSSLKSDISSELLAEQVENEMLQESSFWPKEACTLFLWKIEKPPSRRFEI